MRVLIHPRNITADEGLRTRVTDALGAALASVERHLLRVEAYLTDVNGPRGGPDKRCRVVAHLTTGPIVVSRTGADPVAVVAAAAVQCRRLVLSRLKRRLIRRRLAA